jgi:aspartate aminotransferase
MSDLSARVQRIKVSPSSAAAQRVRDLKAQGAQIYDLTIGEPDFDTPEHIKNAAIDAITRGETKYTPVNGILPLRQAIAEKLAARSGITYAPERITVGGGAKQIIFLALTATLDPGSEVIIPAPYWVSYPDMVVANDGVPVTVTCGEAQQFKLTATQLAAAITPRTRWLILNTPSNPTGVAYARAELEAIADVLRKHPQVGVLTDEIYDELWYDRTDVVSLTQVAPDLVDRVLVVNGVSKTYAMTGWRIGYAAGARNLIDAINVLQSQSSSCPAAVSQFAALAALTGPQDSVRERAGLYQRRRDRAVAMLNAIPGVTCVMPSGAFYLFPNISGVLGRRTAAGSAIDSDQAFVLHLLDKGGVAAIHGSAYGLPGYVRMSIATSEQTLEAACRRIAEVCAALK